MQELYNIISIFVTGGLLFAPVPCRRRNRGIPVSSPGAGCWRHCPYTDHYISNRNTHTGIILFAAHQ